MLGKLFLQLVSKIFNPWGDCAALSADCAAHSTDPPIARLDLALFFHMPLYFFINGSICVFALFLGTFSFEIAQLSCYKMLVITNSNILSQRS